MFGYSLQHHRPGDHVTLIALRGSRKLALDIPEIERGRDEKSSGIGVDELHQLAVLVDPIDGLLPDLGVLGLDIDAKVAAILPRLRHRQRG